MKLTQILFCLLFCLYSLNLMAGAGHSHGHSHKAPPVSQSEAQINAEKVIHSLVTREKVPQSWQGIKPSSIEKIKFNGHDEWLIIFQNLKITEVKKQKLHVFLGLSGEFIAVNYSGQ